MPFNRDALYIPNGTATLKRASILAPLAPAAAADLGFLLDIQIVSVARHGSGDLILLDKKNGRLIRSTILGAIQWNVDCREGSEIPRQVFVDKNDKIWVAYTKDGAFGKIARFQDTNGTVLTRVLTTEGCGLIVGSDGTFMIAYDDVLARIVKIDIGSMTIAKSFLVSSVCPGYDPTPVRQIGMRGSHYYIPLRRQLSAAVDPGKYEILHMSDDVALGLLAQRWPKPLVGTIASAAGVVFAMDEFRHVLHFLSNDSIFAIYALASEGRLQGMALDYLGTTPYVMSDGIFGTARIHAIDTATGISTALAYAPGGPIQGSDLTGYIRGTVVANPAIALLPPTVNVGLIRVDVFAAKTVITGKPGAVVNGTSVTASIGTGAVEADGSFAITGAVVPAGPYTLNVAGPGGNTVVNPAAVVYAPSAAAAKFPGTTFGLDGGFIKVYLEDGGGLPLLTGTHFLRIKENNSGKYWNGSALVASNGLFLTFTLDEVGMWLYHFLPTLPGDYTVFFEEGPVFVNDEILITPEKTQTAEILTKVNQLGAPGAPLLAPASLFTDPTLWGGLVLEKLNRLQFLESVLAFKAKIVFPPAVEGIGLIVSRTIIKTGDTPLIAFTLLDDVTGEPKDLTGHTVHFRARTQPGGQLIFDKTLNIVDAKNGQADTRLTTADTGTAGSFVAEVEDVSPEGIVLSSETFNFTSNPDLT